MFLLPQIREPRSARTLLLPLHHLYALNIGAVDLKPHLDADARELVPQQDPSIDAPSPDVDAHACKRIAGPQAHEQDVAHARAFGVRFGEERRARPGGVEQGDLGRLDSCYWFFEV